MEQVKAFVKTRLFFNLLLVIALFFSAFWVAFLYGKLSKTLVKQTTPPAENTQVVPLKEGSADYKNLLSVVFLGQGGAGHSGGSLTDSIIILSANTQNKTAALISVPRDLWVPIAYDWDSVKNFKVNNAYVIGEDNVRYANKRPEVKSGGNMGKKVLENVTGIPISYFVAIDFSSYEKLIDALGGIDINVPKTFDDAFYPIKGLENETCGFNADQIAEFKTKYSDFELEKQFTCRWEHLHWDKGPAKLTGEQALKFVRSRHGDSDFGRSERQFAVLTGIENKLISLNALTKSSKIIDSLSKLVRTDMNAATIAKVMEILGNPGEYKITEIHITEDNLVNTGKSADGQFILVPKSGNNNFEGIKTYIKSRL